GAAFVPGAPNGVGELHVTHAVLEACKGDRLAFADGVDEVGLDVPVAGETGVRVARLQLLAGLGGRHAVAAGLTALPVDHALGTKDADAGASGHWSDSAEHVGSAGAVSHLGSDSNAVRDLHLNVFAGVRIEPLVDEDFGVGGDAGGISHPALQHLVVDANDQ